MIKTHKQAYEVQQRRFDSGKRGYAKAVRRFLLSQTPCGGDDYLYERDKLPVSWVK